MTSVQPLPAAKGSSSCTRIAATIRKSASVAGQHTSVLLRLFTVCVYNASKLSNDALSMLFSSPYSQKCAM